MSLNSDLQWCIDNDFQVYIKKMNYSGYFKVAIRKGGISTNGKDIFFCKETQMNLYSVEKLGKIDYKNQEKANKVLPGVYKYLKETYQKKL
jgi:hypothetical protein|tara:strand:+ start:5870 stop:6142 length:273 start_codon:yes stop_codon:yes gene_type:complete